MHEHSQSTHNYIKNSLNETLNKTLDSNKICHFFKCGDNTNMHNLSNII